MALVVLNLTFCAKFHSYVYKAVKMASSLSEEEFQRIQEQLLQLRSANYSLEEQCRKKQNEAEFFLDKYENLIKEFEKSQKIISKSKKAKDVELLLQENESLQLKLQSQEDEFRLQNETILKELSTLVSHNEKLEQEVETLKNGRSKEASPSLPSEDKVSELQRTIRKLEGEKTGLHTMIKGLKIKNEDEVANLQKCIRKLGSNNAETKQLTEKPLLNVDTERRLQSSDEKDSGMIQVGNQEVSFHKANNAPIFELLQQSEDRIRQLEKDLEQHEHMKVELEVTKEEQQILINELRKVQTSAENQTSNKDDAIGKLTEKLRKKQESINQLQQEKEALYEETKNSYQTLQASKDQEIQQLKEQLQRLHTQNTNNSQNFQEYREKAGKSIEDLEKEAMDLRLRLDQQSADRCKLLQTKNDALKSLLTKLEIQQQTTNGDLENATAQLMESDGINQSLMQQIKDLENEKAEAAAALEESKKVAEKRKTILDDMAIHLQKKSDEHQQEVVKLTEEFTTKITQLISELEEEKVKSAELEETKSQAEDLQSQVKSLECTKGWFERRLKEAEESLESTKFHHQIMLREQTEKHDALTVEIRADYETRLKDLDTQLEISNAQKIEYEESVAKLKQELKDGIEDRKIHEKKGASIVKDLKRQLQVERKRCERLQDRLQDLLSDSASPRSMDSFRPPTDVGDRAETSSISSWSMMSGGQLDTTRDTQDGSGTGSSLHNGSSPTPPSILEQENNDLVLRVSALQQENWVLEEKVSHLEDSNAAMAEDLMKKQAVIQYYCMEGRNDPQSHHPNFDKLTVKRVVDFIKDKGDANQQEINRKLLRTLEETLTKNMCLQKDLESLSQEVTKLNKASESDYVTVVEMDCSTTVHADGEQ